MRKFYKFLVSKTRSMTLESGDKNFDIFLLSQHLCWTLYGICRILQDSDDRGHYRLKTAQVKANYKYIW